MAIGGATVAIAAALSLLQAAFTKATAPKTTTTPNAVGTTRFLMVLLLPTHE
jgi:hypothetical protein